MDIQKSDIDAAH